MQNTAVVLLFIFSVLLAPVFILSQNTNSGGPRLVIIPPWKSSDAIIARSGGAIVGPYVAPFAVLASFKNSESEEHALNLGAWAIIDGSNILAICGDNNVR